METIVRLCFASVQKKQLIINTLMFVISFPFACLVLLDTHQYFLMLQCLRVAHEEPVWPESRSRSNIIKSLVV